MIGLPAAGAAPECGGGGANRVTGTGITDPSNIDTAASGSNVAKGADPDYPDYLGSGGAAGAFNIDGGPGTAGQNGCALLSWS